MINPRRQNEQIPLLQPDPHPLLISLLPHIKIPGAIQDISDLLVLVHVLVEERLDLVLVDIAHCGRRDGDFIPVLVAARAREGL